MSSRARLSSLLVWASVAACSGARDQTLNNLDTRGRDAALDASEPSEPADDDDASGEPSAVDAGAAPEAATSGDAALLDAAEAGERSADGASDADTSAPEAAVVEAGEDARVESDADAESEAGSDAGAALVRLRVTRAGTPQPSLYVVLHGADGNVLGVMDTDADGRVESALPVRSLTLVLPKYDDSTQLDLFTYAEVETGDDLALDLAPLAVQQDSYLLTLSQPVADAQQYDVYGGPEGCGNGAAAGSPISVHSVGKCFAPANNALVVGAWAPGHSAVLGYALVDGLRGPAPGESDVAASVGVFGPARAVSQAMRGIPPLSPGYSVQLTLYAVLREQWLSVGQSEFFEADAERSIAVPSFAFDGFVSHASWGHPSHWQLRSQLRVRGAGSVAPEPLELGRCLPEINSLSSSEEAGVWSLSWSSEAAAERDAYFFETRYSVLDMNGSYLAEGTWSGLTAPTRGELQLPRLPAELMPVPSGGSVELWPRRLSAVRSSLVQGYAAYRQERLRFFDNSAGELTVPRLDQPGETEVMTWDNTD
jgi:hypothetical protein